MKVHTFKSKNFSMHSPLRFCSHDAFMLCIALPLQAGGICAGQYKPLHSKNVRALRDRRSSPQLLHFTGLTTASDCTSSILLLLMADTLKTPLQTVLQLICLADMTPYACFMLWSHTCEHWTQRIQKQGSQCCSQGHSNAKGIKDLAEDATLEIGRGPSPEWPHGFGLFIMTHCCY